MSIEIDSSANAGRIKKHRSFDSVSGIKRVEVKIPECDEKLVRSLSEILKTGGKAALKARHTISSILPASEKNIVDFFRQSPLTKCEGLEFKRSKNTGRSVQLES